MYKSKLGHLESGLIIVQVNHKMNQTFGKGHIKSVTLRLYECKPEQDEWYGTVTRRFQGDDDVRFFKVVDGVCTFLSRKRKVK